MKLHIFINNNKYIILAISVIFAYLSRYLLDGVVTYSHDNLDSNIVWFKVLGESGMLFAPNDAIIPNIMGGLPRLSYPTEWNVITWLYTWVNPEYAFILNETFIHLMAFIGMYLFLNNYILSTLLRNKKVFLSASIALAFALLPFWHSGGLSIAGQPLLWYAFFNIRNNKKTLFSWLILLLFPLYSSLFLSGFFMLFAFLILLVYDSWYMKRVDWHLFSAIVIISLVYIFVEYRLFYDIITGPLFVSHRHEFSHTYFNGIGVFNAASDLFFTGQYHAHSLHIRYIFPTIILAAILLSLQRGQANLLIMVSAILLGANLYFLNTDDFTDGVAYSNSTYLFLLSFPVLLVFIYKKHYQLATGLGIVLTLAAWYGVWYSEWIHTIRESVPLLKHFHFDRFYVLYPFIWSILFAWSAKVIIEKNRFGITLITAVIISQIIFAYSSKVVNWGNTSFKQYYSEKLFKKIDTYIARDKSDYRVLSIGFRPMIAAYNGFYTLDGYFPNYPLSYKHEFRKIIDEELAKNKDNTKLFDGGGRRCKVLLGENLEGNTIKNLKLNNKQIKRMEGEYIFSKYTIKDAAKKRYQFLKKFKDPNSPKSIFLYKVW